MYVGVCIVEPHLGEYPCELVVIGQKHLKRHSSSSSNKWSSSVSCCYSCWTMS